MKQSVLFATWKQEEKTEFQKLLEKGLWKELHAQGCLTEEQLNMLLKEGEKTVKNTVENAETALKRKQTVDLGKGDDR